MKPLLGVRASAGSGKTWSLTTRYLELLRAGAAPDSILAATFTRKAAGEILARVLSRLARAADGGPAAARELGAALAAPEFGAADAQRLLALVVRRLDRLAVGTLDSFFHRLARAYRYDIDLPLEADLAASDDARAERVRADALAALVASAAERGELDELLALVTDVHEGDWRSATAVALADGAGALYEAWREAPDEAAWTRLVPPAGRLDETDFDDALAHFAGVVEALPAGSLRKAAGVLLSRARARRFKDVLRDTLAGNVLRGEPRYSRAPLPDELRFAVEVVARHALAAAAHAARARGRALHGLARRFAESFDALRRRERLVLFDDVPRLIAPLAAERPLDEIAARLDGALEHLLLDEFQDTAPAQWRILRRLAQSSRTFFAVGDVKQAIYGWRGATPEIFAGMADDLPALEWQALNVSRRSAPVVLEAVDRVLGALRLGAAAGPLGDAAVEWDDAYARHEAYHRDLPGHVVLRTAMSDDFRPAERDDDEIEFVPEEEEPNPAPLRAAAKLVAQLHREAPHARIGVLARTNDAARRMLVELERAGVQASGEGAMEVVDEPAVEAVLSALELADHPGATLSAFHVSHTPLGRHFEPRWEPGEDLGAETRAALSLALRARLLRDGYGAVLAEWASVLAPACTARGARRLAQLVELADAAGAGEPVPLRPIEMVERLQAARAEEPLPAPVRVLTVHRAKGLEFDAVVLPDLDREFLGRRPPLLVHREDPRGAVDAVYARPVKALLEHLPDVARAAELEKKRALLEALSLLYVAMTRARQALYMVVAARRQKADGRLGDGHFRPATLLRAGLGGAHETAAGEEVLYEAGDPAWHRALAPAARAPGGPPALPAFTIAPARRGARRTLRSASPSGFEQGGVVRVDDLLRRSDDSARRHGRLVHAFFSAVRFSDAWPTDAELLRAGRREVPEAPEAELQKELRAFRGLLDTPAVRTALAPPPWPHELLVESAFAAVVDGALLRGRFDRVLLRLDLAGRPQSAEILDFKTDKVTATTLDDAAARYAPQLAAYRAALETLLGLPAEEIRARLLFTATATLR